MSEFKQVSFAELKPGDTIDLADASELAQLEDVIVREINPEYDPESWAGRVALKNLVRPPKFNGRITDLSLTLMNQPYDRLLDARARGWKLTNEYGEATGYRVGLKTDLSKTIIQSYKGFHLTANARSSGRGIIGQIQSELWYYPLRPTRAHRVGDEIDGYHTDKDGNKVPYHYQAKKDYICTPRASEQGRAINRIVAQPKIETEKFIELQKNARRIGFSVLREAMMNPIITPIRD